jgi:hypothetical protein
MMKRKALIAGGLVVLLVCSSEVTVRAEGAPSQRRAAKGWPERFGKRKLYSCEYGFIYAGKKSGANQAKEVLQAVVKDLRQDGVTNPTDGLILVMDSKEKPPVEWNTLVEAVKKAKAHNEDEKAGDALKTLAEVKEKMEKQGLDMDVVLSIAPIPIGREALPEILKEFPQGLNPQVGWCIIVPTDRCVKGGLKKIIDVGMKKEKVGLAKRLMVRALMSLIEHKAAAQVRKTWQAMLYRLVLDAEENLFDEQKEQMHEAYKEKLGLDDKSKGDDNKRDNEGIEENTR